MASGAEIIDAARRICQDDRDPRIEFAHLLVQVLGETGSILEPLHEKPDEIRKVKVSKKVVVPIETAIKYAPDVISGGDSFDSTSYYKNLLTEKEIEIQKLKKRQRESISLSQEEEDALKKDLGTLLMFKVSNRKKKTVEEAVDLFVRQNIPCYRLANEYPWITSMLEEIVMMKFKKTGNQVLTKLDDMTEEKARTIGKNFTHALRQRRSPAAGVDQWRLKVGGSWT